MCLRFGRYLRPNSRVDLWFFYHDNTPAYRIVITQQYSEAKKLKVLNHPPYRPDLAPCDFGLFPYVKLKLRGSKFASTESSLCLLVQRTTIVIVDNQRKKCLISKSYVNKSSKDFSPKLCGLVEILGPSMETQIIEIDMEKQECRRTRAAGFIPMKNPKKIQREDDVKTT